MTMTALEILQSNSCSLSEINLDRPELGINNNILNNNQIDKVMINGQEATIDLVNLTINEAILYRLLLGRFSNT